MKEFIKEINACNDVQVLKRVLAVVLDELDKNADKETAVANNIREALVGEHFDCISAKACINKMSYTTSDGTVINAPFVSDRECFELYEERKQQIKGYNMYDFAVVLNDCMANFHNLLYKWWENEDWCIMLINFSDIAVAWLNNDAMCVGEKAWKVFGNK